MYLKNLLIFGTTKIDENKRRHALIAMRTTILKLNIRSSAPTDLEVHKENIEIDKLTIDPISDLSTSTSATFSNKDKSLGVGFVSKC